MIWALWSQPLGLSAALVHRAQPPPSPLGRSRAALAKLERRGGLASPYPQGQGQGERPWLVRDKVPFGAGPTLGWSILAASLPRVPRLWLGPELGLASALTSQG